MLNLFVTRTNLDTNVAWDILEANSWNIQKSLQQFDPSYQDDENINPNETSDKSDSEKPNKCTTEDDGDFEHNANSEKFDEKVEEAQKAKKWLIVVVNTDKKQKSDLLTCIPLTDFMKFNFIGLMLTAQDNDGSWFCSTYNLKITPFIAIIDPINKRLMEHTCISYDINGKYRIDASRFLNSFLVRNPKYGKSIESEMDDISSSSESEECVQEKGEPVKIRLRLPNSKTADIELFENYTVKTMYDRISKMTGMKPNEIVCSRQYPAEALSDMTKKIYDYNLNKKVIIVSEKNK